MKKSLALLNLLLAAFLMTLMLPSAEISAASFTYYNQTSDSKVSYSGVQPKYVIDGKSINMKNYPTLLSSGGAAMASAAMIFKNGCGAKTSYSSSKQRLTITYIDKVLVMYMGSTTAYLNGTEVNTGSAPFRVTYTSGKTATIVPTRFVAESLGMTYSWDKSTSTVTITTPCVLNINGQEKIYRGIQGGIKLDGQVLDMTDYPTLLFNNIAMVSIAQIADADACLNLEYSTDEDIVYLSRGEITIEFRVGSSQVFVNGLVQNCGEVPSYIYNSKTGTKALYLPGEFTFTTLGYTYSWSKSLLSSVIKTNSATGTAVPADYDKLLLINKNAEAEAVYTDEDGEKHPYYQEMLLTLPDGVNASELDISEDFYNNLISFSLAGDQTEFYKNADISNSGEGIAQIQIRYTEDTDTTEIRIYTRSNSDNLILAFKTEYLKNAIRFIIDEPKNFYEKIIVLDAGHGGSAVGCYINDYLEKDINYNIVCKYCKNYFDRSDIKVYYTRLDDTDVSLEVRAALAKRVQADLFISVHQNAAATFTMQSANGVSVYYSARNIQTGSNGFSAKIMAQMLQSSLLEATGLNSRGTIAQDFDVTYYNTVPAVLIECGFLTNTNDLAYLTKAKNQKTIAKAIYNTVKDIYEEYY